MTNNIHEPTPEFTRFLEWQVTTAVRRQDRFAEPPRPAYIKRLGVAALVVVSMLVGAAGVAAAGRLQANQQTQLLLLEQKVQVELAEMQVALAQKAADDARRRADVGMAGQETVAAAARDLQNAMLTLQRAKLNTEEVGASGRPVQDELTSPLVGRRDFVSERLKLDAQAVALANTAAREKLKAVTTRYEVGLSGEMELVDAQGDVTRAVLEARALHSKTAIRAQFVAGKMTPAAVTRAGLISATGSQLVIAESDLKVATKRYALLQTRFEVGTASEVELLKANLDMVSRQQDVLRLKARIRQLEAGR